MKGRELYVKNWGADIIMNLNSVTIFLFIFCRCIQQLFSDCSSGIHRPSVSVQSGIYPFCLNQNYCISMSHWISSNLAVNFSSQFIQLVYCQFFLTILLVWACRGWETHCWSPDEKSEHCGWTDILLKREKYLMLPVAIKEKLFHTSDPLWCFSS